MQKFIELQGTPNQLLIRSVVCPESIKGYVYVEATKESHVKDAIRGMHILFENGIKLVPLKEMVSVLLVKPAKEDVLHPGDWARVRRGLYREDLCQVHEVSQDQGTVTVRIIPRIAMVQGGGEAEDESTPAAAGAQSDDEGESEAARQRKKKLAAAAAAKKRPASRLFTENEALAVFGDLVRHQRDRESGQRFYVFDGQKFKNGFMLKVLKASALRTQGVKPTLDEIQRFQEARADGEDAAAADFPEIKMPDAENTVFVRGDVVRVVEGEFRNLVGVVIDEHGHNNEVVIDPMLRDLQGRHHLSFAPAQLRRHFTQGDQVRVMTGPHKGESGMLIRIDGEVAVVYSDFTQKEIDVLIDDLQKGALVGAGNLRLGSFTLHDLVSYGNHEVGVIVRIDSGMLLVLDVAGTTRRLSPGDVTLMRTSRQVGAFDSNNNPLALNDLVTVVDGPFVGKRGAIKHIYRYYVFMRVPDIVEHAGMIATRANQVAGVAPRAGSGNAASGNLARTNASPAMAPQSPGVMLRKNDPFGQSGGFGMVPSPQGLGQRGGVRGNPAGPGSGSPGGRSNLLHRKVLITRGEWKGYKGRVLSANETSARVELHARPKVVSVDLSSLKEENGAVSLDARAAGLGARPADSFGAGAGAAPGFGARDAWDSAPKGSRTPSVAVWEGGRTPAMRDIWDKPAANRSDDVWSSSRTPVVNPWDSGSTPSSGSADVWDSSRTPRRADDAWGLGDSRSGGASSYPAPLTPGFGAAPGNPQYAYPGPSGAYPTAPKYGAPSVASPGAIGYGMPATPAAYGAPAYGAAAGGFPLPGTPGFGAAPGGYGTPATPGYGVPTPGGYGVPSTGAAAFGMPSTPGYSVAGPSPGPMAGGYGVPASPGFGVPGTPGFGVPGTPGFGVPGTPGFGVPGTPGFASGASPLPVSGSMYGAGDDVDDSPYAWQTNDIEVIVRDGEAELLPGTRAVIRDISDIYCLVETPNRSSTVQVSRSNLVLVEPKANDLVKVLRGPRRGALYALIAASESGESLCKPREGGAVVPIPTRNLGKYVSN